MEGACPPRTLTSLTMHAHDRCRGGSRTAPTTPRDVRGANVAMGTKVLPMALRALLRRAPTPPGNARGSDDPARYRRAVKGRPGGSPVGCSARWVRNLGHARRRNFGQARKFAGLEGRLLPQKTAGGQIRAREDSQIARQRANIAPSCKAAPLNQPARVNHESGGQGCQLRTRLSSVPANFCACPEILGKFCACPEILRPEFVLLLRTRTVEGKIRARL